MTQEENEMSAPMLGSTIAQVGLRDTTVWHMLRSGSTAESIAVALAEDKARLTQRLVDIESTWPFKMGIMLAALKRQQANIRRWLETGIPADADESRSIAEQIDAAIKTAEDGRWNDRDQRLATTRSPTTLGLIASPLHRLVRDALGLP